MIVTLTKEHMDLAERVARTRNITQRSANRVDGLVRKDSLANDIDGALGEIAVSVGYNEPWTNAILSIEKWLLSRDNLPDVGRWEVKSTRRQSGCLLLQTHARPDAPYVLALLSDLPSVKLAGWLYGWEVQQAKHWRTDVPKSCFMAPQRDLRPMGELCRAA